ncbi:MAG: hypothetical protein ACO1SV_08435 [Fimbriimonas sp.]
MGAKWDLLLADCERIGATPEIPNDLLARWDPQSVVTDDAILVECEPFGSGPVTQLLLRPYFQGDDLRQARGSRTPIPVVAYWRRRGAPWTPASIHLAERFRIGLGGSLTATLVPLIEAGPGS